MKNYRLYLVRHGVTQGNLDGAYIGGGTDEPLCEEGLARLGQLREAFAYPKVNTVFSSPLKRAVGTAEVLFPEARDKIILQDLRESHFGEFEGRKLTELVNDANFRQWMDPAAHYTPKGGENTKEFHSRCSRVLMGMFEYMMKSGIDEAACVTHGGVIVSMLAQRGIPKYPPEHWMADAGCGYELHISPEFWMRDGVAEVMDIIPYGYLDAKPKQ